VLHPVIAVVRNNLLSLFKRPVISKLNINFRSTLFASHCSPLTHPPHPSMQKNTTIDQRACGVYITPLTTRHLPPANHVPPFTAQDRSNRDCQTKVPILEPIPTAALSQNDQHYVSRFRPPFLFPIIQPIIVPVLTSPHPDYTVSALICFAELRLSPAFCRPLGPESVSQEPPNHPVNEFVTRHPTMKRIR
jgi:hypothetical protein